MKTLRLLRPRLAALVLGFGLVFAPGAATPAAAQFGEAAGFGEIMSPYFLKRDLTLISEGLDLDEGQAVILESLYWDYEDEHEAGKVRMLQRLSEMRELIQQNDGNRDYVMKLVFKPFEDRFSEWTDMREQFLENIKAILAQEQLARWDAFRRQLRREKELPNGRLSGESVNLFHVIREMNLEPRTRDSIEEMLGEYGLYLDEVLKRRERLMAESRLAMMHSIRDEDQGASLTIFEQQIAARVALRNANDEFTEIIAAALPAALSDDFRRRVQERAYSRVYRPTAVARLFEEAKRLEGLTPETLAAIDELEAAYTSELAVINDNIRRLIRDYEPAEAQYRAQSFARQAGTTKPDKPADPSRAEFRRRDQMGRRYVEQLQALLTPEQFRSMKGAQRFLRQRAREAPEFGANPIPAGEGKAIKKRIQHDQPPGIGGSRGKGGGR